MGGTYRLAEQNPPLQFEWRESTRHRWVANPIEGLSVSVCTPRVRRHFGYGLWRVDEVFGNAFFGVVTVAHTQARFGVCATGHANMRDAQYAAEQIALGFMRQCGAVARAIDDAAPNASRLCTVCGSSALTRPSCTCPPGGAR